MKRIAVWAVAFAIGCAPSTEKPVMTGAYKLIHQTLTSATAIDSADAPSSQLKIYTPDFLMWAKVQDADSLPSFAIGWYEFDPKKGITEFLIYGARDTTVYDDPLTFETRIEKTPTGFTEQISDIDIRNKRYALKEEYESLGTGAVTPLEGAWRLTRGYHVNGNDTIGNRAVQYKFYNSEYFVYGYTLPDPEKMARTFVGFGKFEMKGGSHSKETIISCNYPHVNGRSFELALEFIGPDSYRQIIQAGKGFDVEEYVRMKK